MQLPFNLDGISYSALACGSDLEASVENHVDSIEIWAEDAEDAEDVPAPCNIRFPTSFRNNPDHAIQGFLLNANFANLYSRPTTFMANFNFNSTRIDELEKKLENYKAEYADSDHEEDTRDVFLGILKDACSLVSEADGFTPDFQDIVVRVDALINDAIDFAYGDGDLYDFMPSFAHSDSNPQLGGGYLPRRRRVWYVQYNPLYVYRSTNIPHLFSSRRTTDVPAPHQHPDGQKPKRYALF